MNIFVLDRDPEAAARALCDRHVVKMALETAQLLSTALRAHGVDDPALYKPSHRAHPCTLWTSATRANFIWLVDHGLAICAEYGRRYGGREHASRKVILRAADASVSVPKGEGVVTPFAQAMPAEYRRLDAVTAYRAYYLGDKARFASWRAPAAAPTWWTHDQDKG